MSVVPSQSYASIGVPLFYPTSTALPVGPTGPTGSAGSAGTTGPTGASGGGGYNPVAAQLQFFTNTPLTNYSSDGSTSVFATKTADTTYNLSNRASYNSTTGRLGPTTGNTGQYLAIITFSWRGSGVGSITTYLNTGTGANYISQLIQQPALRYTSVTIDYMSSDGVTPESKLVYTNPVSYHWNIATVAGVYNASSTSAAVSLLIDTTAAGGNIDIQNATITYVRVG